MIKYMAMVIEILASFKYVCMNRFGDVVAYYVSTSPRAIARVIVDVATPISV